MALTSRSADSQLSANDIDQLRRALAEKRDALVAAQHANRAEQRKVGPAETEAGDLAEQIIEQDSALRLATFDAALLSEIDRALTKIDTGRYGVSEQSGTPIPLARLKAIPWARRTADEEERR